MLQQLLMSLLIQLENFHYNTSRDYSEWKYDVLAEVLRQLKLGQSQADVVKAWKIVKIFPGAKIYANYQSKLKRDKS